MHPLGTIKDVATHGTSLVVGTAFRTAQGAAGLGLRLAGTAASRVFGGSSPEEQDADRTSRSATSEPPADTSASTPEPVNVVEELDLDPAPVSQPEPRTTEEEPAPVTAIDAQADPGQVDVTPADISDQVGRATRGS